MTASTSIITRPSNHLQTGFWISNAQWFFHYFKSFFH